MPVGWQTSLRVRGVQSSGGTYGSFGGKIEHITDRGARVDVPTRRPQQQQSFTVPGLPCLPACPTL
jgi:hypothetical protein